jgi:aspartyl-tRNA(Asn)/glutamyl-tRNA(Gln) amidotransferase subunit B
MRSKEEAHDYRYFPDPDLLPLVIEESWVAEIAAALPELPDDKKTRFTRDYGISAYDAGVLVGDQELANYYEELVRGVDAKQAVNWLNNEILGRLNRDGLTISDCPVSAASNNTILRLVTEGLISGKTAKDVLDIAWTEGGDPHTIVVARGLAQVTDTDAIEKAIDSVIASNPGKVEELKSKPKLVGWFVGQVMKETGGKANPQSVNALLRARLGVPAEG